MQKSGDKSRREAAEVEKGRNRDGGEKKRCLGVCLLACFVRDCLRALLRIGRRSVWNESDCVR